MPFADKFRAVMALPFPGDTVGDAFGNEPPAAGPRRPMPRRPDGGGPPR